MTIDGLNIGNPPGGNQPPSYVADVGNAEEVTFQTSGGLGRIGDGRPDDERRAEDGWQPPLGVGVLQRHEREPAGEDRRLPGLRAGALREIYDLNGAVGGPIKQDRIWYFVNARTQGTKRPNAGLYFNQNAGDATKWLSLPT